MKCEHPSCQADEDILFYCRYCGGSFCERHRDAHAHNCSPKTQQNQGVPPNQATPEQKAEDFLRQFAYSVSQAAKRTAPPSQPVSFPDEKSKKKFIEERLVSSGQLFSLGNEFFDIVFGFSLIVLVFGFYQFITRGSWWGFLIAGILVGTAFVPHEMAHKVVAIRKGQFARYILWVRGLLFTMLTLIIGIGLIVPGFVAIVPMSRQMNKKDLGLVAFAGPAINAIIGAVSMVLGLLVHYGVFVLSPLFTQPNIFILITQFNALIALFNCIPVWQLDGAKILKWNKVAFFVLVAINVALIVPAFILNPTFLSFS